MRAARCDIVSTCVSTLHTVTHTYVHEMCAYCNMLSIIVPPELDGEKDSSIASLAVTMVSRSSFARGKAKSLVPEIKDSVVGTNEDITQDPERPDVLRQIESHESRQALRLTENRLLQHILLRCQREAVGRRELDRNVGQIVNDMAVMEDALPICNRRTEISVDFVHDIRWTSDERRARVDDCL